MRPFCENCGKELPLQNLEMNTLSARFCRECNTYYDKQEALYKLKLEHHGYDTKNPPAYIAWFGEDGHDCPVCGQVCRGHTNQQEANRIYKMIKEREKKNG